MIISGVLLSMFIISVLSSALIILNAVAIQDRAISKSQILDLKITANKDEGNNKVAVFNKYKRKRKI